jgi:hypothetical protein
VRVLLYGDIDLNLIDGSAIWLTSIAEVLARSGAEVLLVRRTPLVRDLLVRELLARPGVTFVDPWAPGNAHLADAIAPASWSRRRLQAGDAARVLGHPSTVRHAGRGIIPLAVAVHLDR